MSNSEYDVVIVGAGNAAFSAAFAAREHAEHVCMLERAPQEELGGNTYFTIGSFRTTYSGLADLAPLLADVTADDLSRFELPSYSRDDFAGDIHRLGKGRGDRTLVDILVKESFERVQWLKTKGVKWRLQDDNQTFEVGGKKRFWGGGTLSTVDGGKGLIKQYLATAEDQKIEVRTEHRLIGLQRDERGRVRGVVCDTPTGRQIVWARSVVLACGGFEADARLRAMYLGPGWDTAKVRGTRYNTGDGLHAAIDAGAQPSGNWSGAHAVAWDFNAPPYGDRVLTNQLQRHSYPFGIMVNSEGERFVDEGKDFRNYTYARIGSAVLAQPGGAAFQIFDQKGVSLLRTDYGHEGITVVEAGSIGELAQQLGMDAEKLELTVKKFNGAVMPVEFNPTIRDGKGTLGLEPPKSNWAQTIDEPPFRAYPAVCAITFTYGGLRIDPDGRVLDQVDRPIAGLHAAGEMVGGLFYDNYPGGSGLMAGSVFGFRAGTTAGKDSSRSG